MFRLATVLLAAGSLGWTAAASADVAFEPAQPTSRDVVRITVDGSMPTPCYAASATVRVSRTRIAIDVQLVPTAAVCILVIGTWQVTLDVGPLPAGTYDVAVSVNGLPWPPAWTAQEAQLLVRATAAAELEVSLCPGDCDGDAAVTIDELTFALNVLLGTRSELDCPALDPPAIDGLVRAVGHALNGCPAPIVADFSAVRRFSFLHGPALGFCPRLGSVLAATLVREHDGSYTLKRTRAEAGDPETDDCLLPESTFAGCVAAQVEPCRTLSEPEIARMAEVFASIAVLPGPVYGCGFEDPCLTAAVTFDETTLADGSCATRRIDDVDLDRLIALLDSLGAGADRTCPGGLCGPGNFVFCSDGNTSDGDGCAADCSEEGEAGFRLDRSRLAVR